MPVRIPEPLRDQDLHRPADQFLARVAEQTLCLRIDNDDDSCGIDDHHTVGRRLEQGPEVRFGGALGRYVADDARNERVASGRDRTQTDLNEEFLTIFPAAP